MAKIFSGFGIDIFMEGGRFFIEFDDGRSASRTRRIEVSDAEAQRARLSERDAYEVLLGRTRRSD